jgi:competence protein ComEC
LRHPEVTRDETPFSDFIGDAFLIRFPSGENMLVDTGMPYSYGEIFDGLKKMGIEKLDFLMITHPHKDHIGNADKILSDFSVSELFLPDHRISLPAEEEELERAVLQKAEKQGVSVRKVGRGDRISVGEGALSSEILVLNPNRSDQNLSDLNGFSIACKISFQSATALLCGDITQREEEQMVLEYGKDFSCDLLKISHHGIVYQNSAPFIDACSPKKAVVQNVRDEGAFIKITSFAMEKANGFSKDDLFVTGKHGKIKAILSDEGQVKITTEF